MSEVGGDDTILVLAGEVALQPEAARRGLVDELQRLLPAEFPDQPIDGVLLGADGADIDDRIHGSGADTGHGDGVLVDIQADKGGAIFGHADLR
jgi:hypothetical protein